MSSAEKAEENPVYKYYSLIATGLKCDRFKCNFCTQEYARHTTRMECHLLSDHSEFCPDVVAAKKLRDAQEYAKRGGATVVLQEPVEQQQVTQCSALDTLLCQVIFGAGLPLRFIEDPRFRAYVQALNPNYSLPCLQTLSTTLLDFEYGTLLSDVTAQLSMADFISVSVDSGENSSRKELLLSFVLHHSANKRPVFWSAVYTEGRPHTAELIAEEIEKVMTSIGIEKCASLTTENSPNMKNSWKLIRQKFPRILALGCSAHGLHLVAKDVVETLWAGRIIQLIANVIKFFTHHNEPHGILKKMQLKSGMKKVIALRAPSQVRWGEVIESLQSIRSSRVPLQCAVMKIDENAHLSKLKGFEEVKQTIGSDNFWADIENLAQILTPIAVALKWLENEKAPLSLFYKEFVAIERQIKDLSLPQDLKVHILAFIHYRGDFLHHNITMLCYLLDPSTQGAELKENDIDDVMEFVTKYVSRYSTMEKATTVIASIYEYRFHEGPFAKHLLWSIAGKTSPSCWWKGVCGAADLRDLALRVFSMRPTAATWEGTFSTVDIIHDARRNRLPDDTVNKLVFAHENLRLEDPVFVDIK